jgi:hypothetical protein
VTFSASLAEGILFPPIVSLTFQLRWDLNSNYCPGWRGITFTAACKELKVHTMQCADAGIEGLILSSEDYAIFSKKYWLNNERKTYYVA